jgi:hypothetical protein
VSTASAQSFKPTPDMVAAAKLVFVADAVYQTLQPIVLKYKTEVLALGQWRVRHEFAEAFKKRSPEMKDEDLIVLDPARDYLISEAEMMTVYAEYDKRRIAAKLPVRIEGNCPLLEAESDHREAKFALVRVMEPITKMSLETLTSAKVGAFEQYVELTLRLLAPFVNNKI